MEAEPWLFFEVVDAVAVGKGSSSLGTISMRKSNWSDLLKALEISERDRVRRLLESAMIKARAVISEMNTGRQLVSVPNGLTVRTHFRKLCRIELVLNRVTSEPSLTL